MSPSGSCVPQRNSFVRSKQMKLRLWGWVVLYRYRGVRAQQDNPTQSAWNPKSHFSSQNQPIFEWQPDRPWTRPKIYSPWHVSDIPTLLPRCNLNIYPYPSSLYQNSTMEQQVRGERRAGMVWGAAFLHFRKLQSWHESLESQTKPCRATERAQGKELKFHHPPGSRAVRGACTATNDVWTLQALSTAPSLPHSPNVPQTALHSTTGESSIKASSQDWPSEQNK